MVCGLKQVVDIWKGGTNLRVMLIRDYETKRKYSYLIEFRCRFATAQVRHRPCSIAKDRDGGIGSEDLEQCVQHSTLQQEITALHTITGNVTKGPHSLITDFIAWGLKQVDEVRDSTTLHNEFGLF